MTGRTYILKHAYSFWEWDEEEGVVAFRDGQTISYAVPLGDLIQELAPQRLPRFGTLLLVLMAMNTPFEYGCEKALAEIPNEDPSLGEIKQGAHAFLTELSQLPESLKTSNLRPEIIKVVFQDCHGLMSVKLSAKIASIFLGSKDRLLPTASRTAYKKEEKEDLRVLAILGRYFGAFGGIYNRLSQLLDIPETIELKAPFPLKQHEVPEDLVEVLKENKATSTIGMLIRPIWAGLSIPYHGIEPSQQPTGGVSDLTNKGNLDKLLLSEYASDDLIFLARLANNEALYLNRESPPASNIRQRIMLIDVSLRNWGRPKTLSMAIAIAIGTHPKTKIGQEAYAVGNRCVSIQLGEVHEIILAMKEVEATLDASEGIREYFINNPATHNREVFILTERSTLQQGGMQQVMSEFRDVIDYTVALDTEGKVDVYKRAGMNIRHLQYLELPLVTAKEEKSTQSSAIPQVKYYPVLMLPKANNFHYFTSQEGDVFHVTKEKILLQLHAGHWDTSKSTWAVICENLPWSKGEFAAAFNKRGEYVILGVSTQAKEFWLFNLFTGSYTINSFSGFGTSATFAITYDRESQSFIRTNSHVYHRISLEGEISRMNDITNAIPLLNKTAETFKRNGKTQVPKASNVFKNLKSVGIDSDGQLALNSHCLLLSSYNILMIDFSRTLVVEIYAEKSEGGRFEFLDGSSVEINESGLIVLQSSDETIPTIYCPSLLKKSLGFGTEGAFAGNMSYLNSPLYQLRVLDFGPKKYEVLDSLAITETEAVKMDAPIILISAYYRERSEILKTRMEKLGATVELVPITSDFDQQEVIEPHEFYDQYIKRFIQTILDHGAHT